MGNILEFYVNVFLCEKFWCLVCFSTLILYLAFAVLPVLLNSKYLKDDWMKCICVSVKAILHKTGNEES